MAEIVIVLERTMSARFLYVTPSLSPGLWLAVITTSSSLIGLESKLGNGKPKKKKKILSTKSVRKLLPHRSPSLQDNFSVRNSGCIWPHSNTEMGCFFSKKSKRKSSEKDDRAPTTTTVETTTTSNAVPLGNNSDEAPKQYSWDKREKVIILK